VEDASAFVMVVVVSGGIYLFLWVASPGSRKKKLRKKLRKKQAHPSSVLRTPDWYQIPEGDRDVVLEMLIDSTNLAVSAGDVESADGYEFITALRRGRNLASPYAGLTVDVPALIAKHFELKDGETVVSLAVMSESGQVEIRPYK
jgi:hypothetical protein